MKEMKVNDQETVANTNCEEAKPYYPKRIVCQQLELLAERSKECTNTELTEFSKAIATLYAALNPYGA